MRRLLALGIAVVLVTGAAPARAGPWFGGVAYHNAVGVGSTNQFISSYSFRGAGVDLRYIVDPYLSVGIAGAWHVLSDRSTDDVRLEDVTLGGRQRRALNAVPILATAHVYTPGPLRLMMGVGVGGSWIERNVDVGVFRARDSNLHFTFAPELGFVLQPWKRTWLIISSRYHYGAAAGDAPEQQWFSFGLGFGGRI